MKAIFTWFFFFMGCRENLVTAFWFQFSYNGNRANSSTLKAEIVHHVWCFFPPRCKVEFGEDWKMKVNEGNEKVFKFQNTFDERYLIAMTLVWPKHRFSTDCIQINYICGFPFWRTFSLCFVSRIALFCCVKVSNFQRRSVSVLCLL